MTRILTESENVYVPAQWRADTSVARTFLAVNGDPARTGSGVVVVDGDTWLDCPGNSAPPIDYPPGPPGSYKPGASTTGPAAAGYNPLPYPATGGPFGNIVSDVLTLTTDNVDVSGYIIDARIVFKGVNQTVRGCIVRGGVTITSGSDVALIDCTASTVRNALIEDCEIAPKNPSLYLSCFRGHDFTEQRNNVHGGCDAYDLYPATTGGALNVKRFATWAHDLAGFGPDTPNNRPFTHNDIVQWTGGTGLTIVGCADYGFLDPTIGQANTAGVNPDYPKFNSNSAFLVTQLQGNCRGLVWTDGWVYGGGATINLNTKGGTAGSLGTIARMKTGHDSYFQGGSGGTDGVYGSGGDHTVVILGAGGFTFDTLDITYEDNGHLVTRDFIS